MTFPRRIYFHIGAGKTGTSALQFFFEKNKRLLKSHGIEYPLGHGMNIQNRFACSLRGSPSSRRRFPDMESDVKEWERIIKNVKTDCCLISSEFFFRCNIQQILRLRELAGTAEIRIVLYVRRQDEILQSRYNQSIKGQSAKKHNVETFLKIQQDNRLIDYAAILRKWADIFGRDNIIVRPYEKQQFWGNTIFPDFLHTVFHLDMTEAFTLPQSDMNPGLHRIALEYKRQTNYLPLTPQQKMLVGESLAEASTYLITSGLKDYDVLSPENRLSILDDCAASNAEVARWYLGRTDGRLFYDPVPSPDEEWHPYDVLQEQDARQLNHFFARHYPAVLAIVRKGILSACSSGTPTMRTTAKLLSPGIVLHGNPGAETLKSVATLRSIYDRIPLAARSYLKRIARKLHIIP